MNKTISYYIYIVLCYGVINFSAFADPTIVSTSDNVVRISNTRVQKARGGGTYVTGIIQPLYRYSTMLPVIVHVFVYDVKGKLLAEKTDKLNGENLNRSRLNLRPMASYDVSFPWLPSQISKVIVIEGSGKVQPPKP